MYLSPGDLLKTKKKAEKYRPPKHSKYRDKVVFLLEKLQGIDKLLCNSNNLM